MIERNIALELKVIQQRLSNIMQLKIDDYGLNFGLLYLMKLIDNNPNSNQKELAREMRLTEGAMSISVKRLMKLGMVEKVQLKEDLRYNKLIITDKGRQVLYDYEEYLSKMMKNIFHGFSQDELDKLNEYVYRVNKNLDNIIENLEEI